MMPARMDGTPSRVCSRAVMKPAAAPASMASGIPRIGCPATASTADTAQPSVNDPSVVISAIFRTRKLKNSAIATRA